MNLTITTKQKQIIQTLISMGFYQNPEEVIDDAFIVLQKQLLEKQTQISQRPIIAPMAGTIEIRGDIVSYSAADDYESLKR